MEENPSDIPVLDFVAELAVGRLPASVGDEEGGYYRPRLGMIVDHASGAVVHFQLSGSQDDEESLVRTLLTDGAKRMGGFPKQILTRSPRIAQQFKGTLWAIGVDLIVRESLPKADEAMDGMRNGPLSGGKREPSLMDSAGMTLDHIIAFAEAAKLFYEAAPWRLLWDDDLIEIETPAGPKGTRFTQVLGAAGEAMGLGFLGTRASHESIQAGEGLKKGVGYWNLLFVDLDNLAFDDGELYETHSLPIVNDQAYPRFGRFTASAGMGQPKTADLVWAEGLLRALAASTEAEFDVGRWEKNVQTINGPTLYRFSMPILLEQLQPTIASARPMEAPTVMMDRMRRAMQQEVQRLGRTPTREDLEKITKRINSGKHQPAFVPSTPGEKAQEICFQAYSARGRRIAQLAKKALEIDPDCCDAYLILAGRVSADEPKLPILAKAVVAGERQFGAEFFKKNTGHFWGLTQTRPYMRARAALAAILMEDPDRVNEGIDHLKALLELNPPDNQGNRYTLAQALFVADRLDEVEQLLNHPLYQSDGSPEWTFSRTLLAYRREGDTPATRKLLDDAIQSYPLVARIISGAGLPRTAESQPHFENIIQSAGSLKISWHASEGAIQWMQDFVMSEAKKKAAMMKAGGWQRKPVGKPRKKKR